MEDLMQKRYSAAMGVAVVMMMIGVSAGHAADKPAAPGPQDAKMQQAQKYMTPGAEHRALDPWIGHWNAKVRMWMKPGDKPQESMGTSETTWVLNKHFVKQDYKGDMNGQPFEGTGYTGFDNVRGEYQSV